MKKGISYEPSSNFIDSGGTRARVSLALLQETTVPWQIGHTVMSPTDGEGPGIGHYDFVRIPPNSKFETLRLGTGTTSQHIPLEAVSGIFAEHERGMGRVFFIDDRGRQDSLPFPLQRTRIALSRDKI